MESSTTIRKRLSSEALDWLLQFHEHGSTLAAQEAFSEWLLRSPMHIAEYLAISSAWQGIQLADKPEFATESLIAAGRADTTRENVIPLRLDDGADAGSRSVYPHHRSAQRRWLGLAACVILCAALWLGYLERTQVRDFQTAIGEQRSITLADGSEVLLNTNSEIRVKWSRPERHIDLQRGEARFHVAKNPARPFVVETRDAAVRALGTVFNVRANEASTEVTVLQGRVKLTELPPVVSPAHRQSDEFQKSADPGGAQTDPASVELDAGQRAAVRGARIELGNGPTPESASAWTQKRLIFRDQSLAAVIREFNRYRVAPIVIDSPQLEALRINGVFEFNDPYSLAAYLRDFEAVHVTWSDDGTVHLSRDVSQHK